MKTLIIAALLSSLFSFAEYNYGHAQNERDILFYQIKLEHRGFAVIPLNTDLYRRNN